MLATTDLYDAHEKALTACLLPFHDYGGRRAFHGPVRTVVCLEDNVLIRSVLSEDGNGGVLIVDGGGSRRTALMGDQIARLGMENGWAGIIINGAVRDSRELARLDFGIKALGTNPVKSGKVGRGAVDVPVTFGGVLFVPGNWVYCDGDGVLVAENSLKITG
jgi:regulator of ribonuclease activity A